MPRRRFVRRPVLLVGVGLLVIAGGWRAAAPAADEAPAPVGAFLAQHCIACHGPKAAKGDLRLDTLGHDFADKKTADAWVRVFERMRDGEMPPRKQPRPPAAEAKRVLDWIAAGTATTARPAAARRLNRVEYEYTLRDLLDLPGLEVKELLPRDGEADGFDTAADALDVSYVQMARYLEAADAALDLAAAVGLPPTRPEARKIVFWPQDTGEWPHRSREGATIPLSVHGVDPCWDRERGVVPREVDQSKLYRFRAMGTFFHSDAAGLLRFDVGRRLPGPGLYRIRASCYTFEWDKGTVLPAKESRPYSLATDTRTLGYFDAPPNDAGVSTVTAWLGPTDSLHFNAVSLVHGFGTRKGALDFKLPGVAVEWIELEGPLNPQWPPPARTRLFGDLPLLEWQERSKTPAPSRPPYVREKFTPASADPAADAERLLRDFLHRAARRPVPAEAVQPFVKLVRARLEEKVTFEEALRTGYKAILCSPHFLFLRSQPGKAADQYALANRLSYFLWSGPPDEELLRKAGENALARPDVLRAQTERLLKDPKAQRFVDNFTGQWLKLRDINANQPDAQLYPEPHFESDVASYLVDSMADETRQTFAAMLRDDLSASHVVAADFALLNEPLAKLYGVKGVQGAGLRKVALPKGSRRGGLLTQASLLRVSANGTTTSPVVRGVFVANRLLGRTVPPPPPNVPGLDPDVRGATTIREQLAKHRSDAACAGCHARMDPFGFALESFDVAGAWRDRYRILVNGRLDRNGPPVDPAGETDDGRPFRDVDELRTLLLADVRPVARNLATKLLTYAVGRPPAGADRLEIEQLLDRLRPGNYGVRALLHEVVQSRAFRQE